jgi:hypothetical protein
MSITRHLLRGNSNCILLIELKNISGKFVMTSIHIKTNSWVNRRENINKSKERI